MNAQDVIFGARVAHVRELKTEIERLKLENTVLRGELQSFRTHLDQALLAAEDLKAIPEGGRLEIWDGWNLVLGAKRRAESREELIAQAHDRVAKAGAELKIWIVFDGKDENVSSVDGGVRVSYSGGAGAHRADRFICDFVRMAAYLGLADRLGVVTDDYDFIRAIEKMTVCGKYDIICRQ